MNIPNFVQTEILKACDNISDIFVNIIFTGKSHQTVFLPIVSMVWKIGGENHRYCPVYPNQTEIERVTSIKTGDGIHDFFQSSY
ncbi:hypothetical protein ACIXQ7_20480 [Bacteroides fragilis]